MPDGSDWPERWEPPYLPKKRTLWEVLCEIAYVVGACFPGVLLVCAGVTMVASIPAVFISVNVAGVCFLVGLGGLFVFVLIFVLHEYGINLFPE